MIDNPKSGKHHPRKMRSCCNACQETEYLQYSLVSEVEPDLTLLGVVLVSCGTPAASRASLTCQGALSTGMVLWMRSSAAAPS